MRRTGLMLILTAVATVVAVVGRVWADADHETLADSLAAIAERRGLYGLGGAGRLLSGVTLIAAGWFLFGSASHGRRERSVILPFLFAMSGALTACSGASAVALAAVATEGLDAAGLEALARHQEATAWLRRFTGAAGFALAGLALIVIAWRQWGAGGSLKRIAPASALLGLAIQFVWLDAATVMHIVTGTLFVAWLVAGGRMLLKGGAWIPG
ncbi:MAG: hypothetical protein OXG72_21710 [Acidobacteria bacterium]|nr:hypothetical protein [Acidobacteriota bacterium]